MPDDKSKNVGENTAKKNAEYKEQSIKLDSMIASIDATLKGNESEAAKTSLQLFNTEQEIKRLQKDLDKAKEDKSLLEKKLHELSIVLNIAGQMQATAIGGKVPNGETQ